MRRLAALLFVASVVATGCSSSPQPIVLGAIYPLTGSQARGGIAEHRGVLLAAELVNQQGGINGRPIELRSIDVPGSDAAAVAVDRLAQEGVRLVVGSYGSTISEPAAAEAARRGLLFWETGAVGQMAPAGQGRLVFRFAPTGAVLGSEAVDFVAERLAPMLHRSSRSLRFAVANVDDAYGRAVAAGALDAIRTKGLRLAGRFPYDLLHPDYPAIVRRMAAARPDVLFVSGYVDDAVALRKETVRQHLPLIASIGTSSSYCMPEFGAALGPEAVGLFASDKPDAFAIDTGGLRPAGRAVLMTARSAYRRLYNAEMDAPALAGFSAAWALFHDVLPRASAMTPAAVGAAARATTYPPGTYANGSGMRFSPPGSSLAGSNLEAASVIWEWVAPGQREVVWPPGLATHPVEALPLAQ
jgi:branched-chain amino acid transport system substrate-binding protein